MDNCWATIGVRGDASCPDLQQHVHCRNCPVYSTSAMRLLDAEPPAGELAKWTSHFAERKHVKELGTQAVVIFRVGAEWLALPAPCVAEVTNPLPIHRLPHRPSAVILGLANVRGELVVCASLLHLLELAPAAGAHRNGRLTEHKRLLVIRRELVRAVCPVDEVHGVHRFHPRELKELPATVAKASTYSRALLSWSEHTVGVLDDERLFAALKRSVA
jgi:chemotaxis-related protein WspD